MRVLGEAVAIRIRPLNDTKAIETGANFLSEGFIFSVAGSLILFESLRARNKEIARRESVADDIATLQDEIELLKRNLVQQKILVDEYKVPSGVNPSVLKLPKVVAPNIYEQDEHEQKVTAVDVVPQSKKQQQQQQQQQVKAVVN